MLEKLGRAGKTTGELIEAMTDSLLFPRRGTSLSQNLREVDAFHERRLSRAAERESAHVAWEAEQQRKQRVYEYVSKLKAQGFIDEQISQGRSVLVLSTKGIQKLEQLRKTASLALPDVKRYRIIAGPTIVIISFDVPDKQARKRYWLRAALQNLQFKKIQQSVYLGKGKLPEEFLSDLVQLKLTECVEIFSINKIGSLRHLQ